jgi:ATP-dependent DNA helicase 2 subunit 2
VEALLGDESKGKKISTDNPVPDFKRILGTSEEVSEIEDAAKQMGSIIRELITDSFGDSKYDQAMECLGTMREELINLEEPSLYNTFVKDLKKNMLSGALGGDRRDFWFQIRGAKMGLIDTRLSEVSDVSPETADEVSFSAPVWFHSRVLTISRNSSTNRGDHVVPRV